MLHVLTWNIHFVVTHLRYLVMRNYRNKLCDGRLKQDGASLSMSKGRYRIAEESGIRFKKQNGDAINARSRKGVGCTYTRMLAARIHQRMPAHAHNLPPTYTYHLSHPINNDGFLNILHKIVISAQRRT